MIGQCKTKIKQAVDANYAQTQSDTSIQYVKTEEKIFFKNLLSFMHCTHMCPGLEDLFHGDAGRSGAFRIWIPLLRTEGLTLNKPNLSTIFILSIFTSILSTHSCYFCLLLSYVIEVCFSVSHKTDQYHLIFSFSASISIVLSPAYLAKPEC